MSNPNWGYGNNLKRLARDRKFRAHAGHPENRLVTSTIDTGMHSYQSKDVSPELRAKIDAALAAKREGKAA